MSATSTAVSRRRVETPVGTLWAAASSSGLRELLWSDPGAPRGAGRGAAAGEEHLDALESQLARYFAGELRAFDLALDLVGTPFQLEVWAALMDVPYGRTTTYGQQAERIGRPSAVRAVGTANGRNPVSIVVPCHRVVGADGSLTGYAGGLEVKRRLLGLERGTPELF